ncbi:MAG: DUF72 domain-containing protein [Betaproteobacteria bacterium]|nr:DUF72 domain-containing protein [Betaproteobacteria bacterium]
MPHSPTYKVYFGTAGWEHPDWPGRFYPDDLPAEWRLAYYANLFSCAYLDFRSWCAVDAATLARWGGDTLDRFRFLLEAPPVAAEAKAAPALAGLGPKGLLAVDGRVQDGCGWEAGKLHWVEPDTDLRNAARDLQRLAAVPGAVFVISRSAKPARVEELRTLMDLLGL